MRLLHCFLIFVLCSCVSSKGFDRVKIRELLEAQYGQSPLHPTDATEAAGEIQISRPAKIGVMLRPPLETGWNPTSPFDAPIWNWTPEDLSGLGQLGRVDRGRKLFAEFGFVPESIVNLGSTEEMLSASSSQGLDGLLVVSGALSLDFYHNQDAWFYWFFFPMFFVDGNELDTLFSMRATLWDLKTMRICFSVESEGSARKSLNPLELSYGNPYDWRIQSSKMKARWLLEESFLKKAEELLKPKGSTKSE